MRIFVFVFGLVAVATLIWAYLRWTQKSHDGNNRNDAEHYASLLNLYAQDCTRHLEAAQNPERSWKNRMDRLNQAIEAKQKHAETLGEAPTDMRGQDLDAPPSANLHSLRSELFNARKGEPDLPWRMLHEDEQIQHAQTLERTASQLRAYGDTTAAEEVDTLIEDIYQQVIDQNPTRPVPYLKLVALYQRQKDLNQESEVLRRALDQAEFEDEQRKNLQNRLEKLQQLRGA